MKAASHIRYIICTNPRTGSTLLSDKLMSTGVCGNNVRELFHVERFFDRHKNITNVQSYIRDLFSENETLNGAAGFKVHFLQLSYLKIVWRRVLKMWIDETYILDQFPPETRHIFLYRKDKLQQAISYYIAISSNQWSSRSVAQGSVRVHLFTPIIIAYYIRMFERLDQSWKKYFQKRNITPMIISYEDLQANADQVTRNVCKHIGIEVPPDIVLSTTLQKQANQLSIDLEQQFHATSQFKQLLLRYPYVIYRVLRTCARCVFLTIKA